MQLAEEQLNSLPYVLAASNFSCANAGSPPPPDVPTVLEAFQPVSALPPLPSRPPPPPPVTTDRSASCGATLLSGYPPPQTFISLTVRALRLLPSTSAVDTAPIAPNPPRPASPRPPAPSPPGPSQSTPSPDPSSPAPAQPPVSAGPTASALGPSPPAPRRSPSAYPAPRNVSGAVYAYTPPISSGSFVTADAAPTSVSTAPGPAASAPTATTASTPSPTASASKATTATTVTTTLLPAQLDGAAVALAPWWLRFGYCVALPWALTAHIGAAAGVPAAIVTIQVPADVAAEAAPGDSSPANRTLDGCVSIAARVVLSLHAAGPDAYSLGLDDDASLAGITNSSSAIFGLGSWVKPSTSDHIMVAAQELAEKILLQQRAQQEQQQATAASSPADASPSSPTASVNSQQQSSSTSSASSSPSTSTSSPTGESAPSDDRMDSAVIVAGAAGGAMLAVLLVVLVAAVVAHKRKARREQQRKYERPRADDDTLAVVDASPTGKGKGGSGAALKSHGGQQVQQYPPAKPSPRPQQVMPKPQSLRVVIPPLPYAAHPHLPYGDTPLTATYPWTEPASLFLTSFKEPPVQANAHRHSPQPPLPPTPAPSVIRPSHAHQHPQLHVHLQLARPHSPLVARNPELLRDGWFSDGEVGRLRQGSRQRQRRLPVSAGPTVRQDGAVRLVLPPMPPPPASAPAGQARAETQGSRRGQAEGLPLRREGWALAALSMDSAANRRTFADGAYGGVGVP